MLTIQLLARWASDVILRYVAEAPLEALTPTYRRAMAEADLDTTVAEILTENTKTKKFVEGLDGKIRNMVEEEIAKRRAQHSNAHSCEYVQGEGRGRVAHAVRTNPLIGVPPNMWATRCGWRFGLSRHQLRQSCDGLPLCGTCFPSNGSDSSG